MRFLIRALFIFIAISAGLSVVRGLFRPRVAARPARPARPESAGRLVKDPVCGTYIPEDTALRASDQFFCSEECRTKFIKA